MLEVNLTVELKLIGPILTQSTAIGAPGIDAPVARTADKVCYIPGSLIRGKLRQSWIELNDLSRHKFFPDIKDWLGDESGKDGSVSEFKPKRTRLSFTDFLHIGDNQTRQDLRYRIHIDSSRGSVEKGALMVIESPFAPGGKYTFKGTISYIARDKNQAEKIKTNIEKGLCWITSLGAERTVGFGRLNDVEIKYDEKTINPNIPDGAEGHLSGIRLEIQQPFCVAKRRKIDNLFESEYILSGSVLRGAIATTLSDLAGLTPGQEISEETLPEQWNLLGRHFNKIAYSHAFPVKREIEKRPVVPPQSLVKVSKDLPPYYDIYDIALCNGPVLIGNPPLSPAFAIDWKESADVFKEFGWDEPERELRVRTKINNDKRRAEEGQLFAYEMVLPEKHHWLARINLSRIPEFDRRPVEVQLRTLFAYGIHSLGKTKAKASVKIDNSFAPYFVSDANPVAYQWVITLQTPTLLCDPASLNEISGKEELFQVYNKVWREISAGTLTLLPNRYFARQSLSGRYLIQRFQSNKPYNPFLLTDAGSVFVLEATGEIGSARSNIERWLQRGLDLPGWAKERYGDDWRTNPYLPEDGFGEIAVNLPCHQQMLPKEVVVYVK